MAKEFLPFAMGLLPGDFAIERFGSLGTVVEGRSQRLSKSENLAAILVLTRFPLHTTKPVRRQQARDWQGLRRRTER